MQKIYDPVTLTKKEKKFILDNHTVFTIRTICDKLNLSYYKVWRFYAANKLTKKNERRQGTPKPKAPRVAEGFFDWSDYDGCLMFSRNN